MHVTLCFHALLVSADRFHYYRAKQTHMHHINVSLILLWSLLVEDHILDFFSNIFNVSSFLFVHCSIGLLNGHL